MTRFVLFVGVFLCLNDFQAVLHTLQKRSAVSNYRVPKTSKDLLDNLPT